MAASLGRRPEEHARSRVCFACSWRQGGVPAAPGFTRLADSRYQAVNDLGRAHDVRTAYLIFMRRGWASPPIGNCSTRSRPPILLMGTRRCTHRMGTRRWAFFSSMLTLNRNLQTAKDTQRWRWEPGRPETWLIQGITTGISDRPLKEVTVCCWEGRSSGPFATLASWRLKAIFGSGLSVLRGTEWESW